MSRDSLLSPFSDHTADFETHLDTVVVNMAVWGGCTIYYFVDARKWFTGPKTTVEEVDEIAGHEVTTERDGVLGDGKVAEAEGSGAETEKQQ